MFTTFPFKTVSMKIAFEWFGMELIPASQEPPKWWQVVC